MEIVLLDEISVSPLVREREKFSHKGTYGHALLVAGSKGRMGAAILSAKGCLRAGAGLLTVHLPACGLDIMQIAVPEAMCVADANEDHITSVGFDKATAVGIGPGIGTGGETLRALEQVLESGLPCVIDADALNLLSANKHLLTRLNGKCILTPHPGEFARLAGESGDRDEQLELQLELSSKYGCVTIVKDAETRIVDGNGRVFHNTTGNPGMATGGSGDVLTGIILGLLAQGYSPEDAAKIAVYHHGLAGDRAAAIKGQYALIAGDLTGHLRIA
jgi:ADP-dependent NAD(P)H-hydrate dehydratase / NAD(P)H-hydrate epimerase